MANLNNCHGLRYYKAIKTLSNNQVKFQTLVNKQIKVMNIVTLTFEFCKHKKYKMNLKTRT